MQKIKVWQTNSKIIWFINFTFISLLILYAIGLVLPYLPEPLGSRSDIFIVGTQMTLLLSVISGAIGLIIGVGFGLAKLSKNVILLNTVNFLVWILRGTPLLTQLLFVYYVLPIWLPWLKLNEFTSAIIALSCNVAAYNADVVTGGILAVPKGQFEAGYSLGLSKFRIMYNVIFPQSFKISMPALINNFIALIKDSSLASGIGLLELTLVGTRISSETFNPLPVLTAVSIIYLGITSLINIGCWALKEKFIQIARPCHV